MFIYFDGISVISKKWMFCCYNYSINYILNVMLEMVGIVDLDVEIKFKIGLEIFFIDVYKKYIEEVKDLYKVLFKMFEIMCENEIVFDFVK